MLALPAPSDCLQEQTYSSVDVDTPEVPPVETITQVQNLDDYFLLYGRALAHKVQETLDPLHVPERDPLPDWKKVGFNIHLIPGQEHCVAGAVRCMDEERNLFINGETGTGKTYMACGAVHTHASRPRNQGGKNGVYVALALCPDHLMDKWARHIRKSIPSAKVIQLEGTSRQAYQQLLQLKQRSYLDARGRRRWAKLNQPIWIVMGRNQSKFFPDAVGVGDLETPTGKLAHRKTALATRKTWGYDQQKYIYKSDVVDTIRCPRCGKVPHSEQKKVYTDSEIANKRRQCCNFIGVEIQDPKRPNVYRGDRIISAMPTPDSEYYRNVSYGDLVPGRKFAPSRGSDPDRKYRAEYCGEFLWQYSKEKLRWPPSMIMKKQLHGLLDYLVCDEAHEQKSGESVQSQAFGRLLGEAKHTICLTGTLIGGYAKDVFDLVTRMRPWAMTALGYEWGKVTPFTEAYGMRTLTVTQTIADSGKVDSERNMRSSRKRKRGGGSDTSENWTDRPGIMPRLFPDVLMPMACYLSLSDIMEGLPPLTEYVVQNILDLPDDVFTEYRRLEAILTGNAGLADKLAIFGDEAAAAGIVNELRKKGAIRKIVGTMNTVLLKYVDRPWDWEQYRPDVPEGKHPVGFFQDPSKFGKDESTWIGLTTPLTLDRNRLLPKEERTIEICKANKAKGRKTWVYVTSSGNTDVRPRLREVLRQAGLQVGILQDSIPLQEREAWITKHTPKVDVMISHPQLVSTGLDLLDYPTLVFYELDWNMTLVWQASRRAWRIGQKQPCEVHYLTYRNTAQMHQLNIMAKKKAAALALNGKLSEEGLAAMAGDEMGAQMELAKMVGNQIDESDLMRKWGKMTYGNLEFASTTVEEETVDMHSEGSTENPEESSEFDASEETGIEIDVTSDAVVVPAPKPETPEDDTGASEAGPEPEPVIVKRKRAKKKEKGAAAVSASGDTDDEDSFALSDETMSKLFRSVFGEDYQEPSDDEIW